MTVPSDPSPIESADRPESGGEGAGGTVPECGLTCREHHVRRLGDRGQAECLSAETALCQVRARCGGWGRLPNPSAGAGRGTTPARKHGRARRPAEQSDAAAPAVVYAPRGPPWALAGRHL